MRKLALGVYTYAEFGAIVAAFMPVMAASWLRHRGDPAMRESGRWMRRLGWLTSRMTPLWDFGVKGEGPADIHNTPYVVVANHESTADPFLISYLPWDMRWVGKEELFKLPEWTTVQRYPSGFRFPNGESFAEMQLRIVSTIDRLRATHAGKTIVCVSHADPIKAALASAVGTHLDLFQRIVVSPCSVSAVLYGAGGPVVLATNSTGRDLRTLQPS